MYGQTRFMLRRSEWVNNNNDNAIHFKCAPRAASLLWVNLTAETHTALGASAAGNIDVHGVRECTQISAAIQVYAPLFLCFEFDQPDALNGRSRRNPMHAPKPADPDDHRRIFPCCGAIGRYASRSEICW